MLRDSISCVKRDPARRENDPDLLRGSTPAIVLALLKESPDHGYSLAKRLNEKTGDRLKFKQGTLYPVLHGLERDGWVRSEWLVGEDSRPKKVYSVTEAGLRELQHRTDSWRRFATAVNEILGVNHEQPTPAVSV